MKVLVNSADVQALNGLMADKRFLQTFDNLATRWADEKEYEDIADYGDVLKSIMPAGCVYVGMSKSPFGVDFSAVSGKKYRLKATRNSIQLVTL